jgi:hypothetical protein
MSEWTDTIEKTLETIRQNSKKLSQNYIDQYNAFKSRLLYLNVPLVVVSLLNAYTIFESGSFSRGVEIGSSAASLVTALVLGGELCYGIQMRMEKSITKFKDYESLEKSIQSVLSLDRLQRKIHSDQFLKATLEKYKELVAEDEFILKFSGNIDIEKEFNEHIEDLQSFLNDHWNILFRPKFRRIKKKNEKVIEALKTTKQNVEETLENIVEEIKPAVTTVNNTKEKFGEWVTSWLKKEEENKEEDPLMEISAVYPQTINRVIYEPTKRGGISMSFQDKK